MRQGVFTLLLFPGIATAVPAEGVEDRMKAGWSALDKKDYVLAANSFQEVLQEHREIADAHVGRGIALLRLGYLDRALQQLERGRDLGSKYEHLDLELGRARFANKKFAEAITPLEEYKKSHPAAWETYELLGGCYYYTRQWDRCIEAFESPVLKGHPEHEAADRFLLGMAYAAKRDRTRAATIFRDVADRYPSTRFGTTAAGMFVPTSEMDAWARARQEMSDKWW